MFDINIQFNDSCVQKHFNSDEELSEYCLNLSIFIGIAYLRKTIINIIKYDFFYFSASEQKLLLNNSVKDFDIDITTEYIYYQLKRWFSENNKLNLDGFVTFRLKKYHDYIYVIVQENADKLIVEIEKAQIINYFKTQLNQQLPYIDTIYIYSNDNCYKILNESYENIVSINHCDELLLNVIISIAPINIYFHGECDNPAFFDTLTSVFENRLKLMN